MPNFEQIIADVQKQIAGGNTQKAITILKAATAVFPNSDIYQSLLVTEGQFKTESRKYNMGTIDNNAMRMITAQINSGLLELLKELPDLTDNDDVITVTKTIHTNTHDNKDLTISQTFVDNLPPIMKVATKKNVLFLASNPSDTARLQLDKEFRIVSQQLQNEQDNIKLRQVFELTADKLHQAMLTEKPEILHFSGHGLKSRIEQESLGGSLSVEIEKSGGIVLQNSSGTRHIVETQAIANLFKLTMKSGGKIEVVLFNACYSEEQAKAINEYVPFVIGMNNAVEDGAAIEFTTGFYRALSEGQSIELAFEWGVAKVELEGYTGTNIPVLHKKTV